MSFLATGVAIFGIVVGIALVHAGVGSLLLDSSSVFRGSRPADRSPEQQSTDSPALPHDAVLEVRHVVVPAEPGLLQLDSLRQNVEQRTTTSEQDVDHVDPELVHEPRGEVLLVDVRAHEPDPLLAGGLPRLRERTLDPVGDEREDRVRVSRSGCA